MKIAQTRISIDRLKIAAFMSEETLAFTARVLLDGNPFAHARNAGHGGSTDVLPAYSKNATAQAIAHGRMAEANAYCRTLRAEPWKFNGQILERTTNLDDVVDELVADAELDKRVRAAYKRTMKKYLCYALDGKIYQYKRAAFPTAAAVHTQCERIHAERPGAVVFDMLPSGNAYELFKRLTVKEA